MSFEGFAVAFFNVLDTYLFNLKGISLVLFMLFAILFIGYALGRINIKGISLGSAAIFLVALVFGHFKGVLVGYKSGSEIVEGQIAGWASSLSSIDTYFKLFQNLGLVLFVTAVGLIAGPTFFKNLKKNAKSYVFLGAIVILTGSIVTALIILFAPGMTPEMGVGLMSGALTSTPSFSAAQTAMEASANYVHIAVGHAVAYPFGVIGVVLFVQIMPLIKKVNMEEERKKLTPVSSGDTTTNSSKKKLFELDKFGIGAFSITVMLGLILGAINIPLFGGTSFSLGATGGPLIVGLILGHFGRLGNVAIKVKEEVIGFIQEFGLILFLVGAGIEGGAEFIDTIKVYGGLVFVYGALMTLVPMIIGYIVAEKVLKLSLLNSLGSLTGGMTSTPALGTLIKTSGTSNVASAYAATYPIALVLIVLLSQLLSYVPPLN